jgi:anti-sigma regulatory factor (Ser/Thr protein kinase)
LPLIGVSLSGGAPETPAIHSALERLNRGHMTTSQVGKPALELVRDTPSDVTVLTGSGRLDLVAPELERRLLYALAEEPQGIVCDLSQVVVAVGPERTGLLDAFRETLAWPGTPVAMASADAGIRSALRRLTMTDHVMVRSSLERAHADVAGWPSPSVVRSRLSPRATASREARDITNRACLEWGIRHEMASLSLVVSELVTNALLHATPGIDLSLAMHGTTLRLAVRDRSNRGPRRRRPGHDQTTGRGLTLVEHLVRTWGVLPTDEGGKVVWAVLDV